MSSAGLLTVISGFGKLVRFTVKKKKNIKKKSPLIDDPGAKAGGSQQNRNIVLSRHQRK